MLLPLIACFLTSAYGNEPIVTEVRLGVQDQIRHVTVSYLAEEKPVILWKTGDYITHLENSTNSFSSGQGEATVRIYVDPRRDYLDHDLVAEIYSDSYHMSLYFREGDIRLSESESSDVVPVKLSTSRNGTITFDPDDVVTIELNVEAVDLSVYRITRDWGRLESFEYMSYPPVLVSRSNAWREYHGHFESANAFIMPRMNGSSHTTARIDTSYPMTTGEVEFGVILNLVPENHLLEKIVLRRFVYLKNSSDESPFKRNANFAYDRRNRKREDILTDTLLYTQVDAIGYPKPVPKLYRECTELTEPEVKVYEIGTPYRTRHIYQFMNASDSLTGAYYFKVFSGDNEITRMNYITKL